MLIKYGFFPKDFNDLIVVINNVNAKVNIKKNVVLFIKNYLDDINVDNGKVKQEELFNIQFKQIIYDNIKYII